MKSCSGSVEQFLDTKVTGQTLVDRLKNQKIDRFQELGQRIIKHMALDERHREKKSGKGSREMDRTKYLEVLLQVSADG